MSPLIVDPITHLQVHSSLACTCLNQRFITFYSFKYPIITFLWDHFRANFDRDTPCTFHFICSFLPDPQFNIFNSNTNSTYIYIYRLYQIWCLSVTVAMLSCLICACVHCYKPHNNNINNSKKNKTAKIRRWEKRPGYVRTRPKASGKGPCWGIGGDTRTRNVSWCV